MPFGHLSSSTMPQFKCATLPPGTLPAFDPSSPLILPEPEAPKALTRTNKHGVPGDVEDMLPVFDACLRVGKLDRAALVLRRLKSVGALSIEEQVFLSNQYLRASLRRLQALPDANQAESLHRWYELQLRNKGIPHTAETIACMLKASLLSERGPRLQRLVRRYMGMAPGEAGLRVLSMADILSDQDLAVITEICPTYNYSADFESDDISDELGQPGDINLSSRLEESRASFSAEFPKVRATPQKGYGLKTLKEGVNLLSQLQDVDLSQLSKTERQEVQLQLERDSITSAISKWRQTHDDLLKKGINTAIGGPAQEGSLTQQMGAWLCGMEDRLKKEFLLVEESEKKECKSEQDLLRCIYGPLLMQVEPARLAAVTILSVLNLGTMAGINKGIVVSKLITNIVRLLQEDIRVQQKEKAKKDRKRRRVKFSNKSGKVESDTLERTQAKSHHHDFEIIEENNVDQTDLRNLAQKPWPLQIRAQIGAILLKTLIESAKCKVTVEHPTTKELVNQYQPAFSHVQQPRRGKKVGIIAINHHLLELLKREPTGDLLAKHLPMVVEPKPWRQLNEGGYLDSRTNLVRVKPGEIEQRLYTKAAIKRGDMDQVFKGLDILGRTAWRINKDVLKVMLEAWNSGEAIANMPPLDPVIEVPPEPSPSADPLLRRKWMKAIKAAENDRSSLHSQRCFMNLQLEIARVFRNQTMYFPHNVDYRGRAYPVPTYLNHMGADHTRGLLKFASGKRLGERGLRWLQIHLANVYGLDKASFDERAAFATENLANIIESATNPLYGSRWWLKGEDPWQCLAACFELKAAHELEDPTQYISHLPVHQDGTCNGLQHYAALGGDTWGAKQVNLEPGDRPADVYAAVAKLVQEGIAKDAERKHRFALIMDGKITRKVVKQTVMTNVYGVTFAGAKKQVCKQIDALYPNIEKETGVPAMLLSTYVAQHIFKALASMFRGAHDIQYWLGEIGGRVCRALTPAQLQQISEAYEAEKKKASAGSKRKQKTAKAGYDELTRQFRSTVVWTTPLRMPVAQPYRKNMVREIRTCLQSVIYPVSDQTDPVNRRKQLQGFPPNFIHSLDASHMLLSALKCDEQGLTFAAVHDSFWTHAGDIDTMNTVLRDAFIRIHEEDVVGRLAKEFEARHKGSVYLAHINPNTPVAKKIRQLRERSKMSPQQELLLEHKRVSLRISGNPWDLEAAKQIVTPAAIYEEMAASEEDVEIKADTKDIALGTISETSHASASEVQITDEDEASVDDEEALDAELDGAALALDWFEEGRQHSAFESSMMENKKTPFPKREAKKQTTSLPVWLPLTIPPVPKKGDFDVTRLRESKYFFS